MAEGGLKEIQLAVFKIGREEFGVPINQVKEIVRLIPITPVPHASDFIEGVVNLRGNIITVVDLAQRLKLNSSVHSDKTRIIIIEIKEDIIGMVVDEVIEVLHLDTSSIEPAPEIIATGIQKEYLKGVGKLGERLLILIDLVKAFSLKEIEEAKKTGIQKTKQEAGNGREKAV